MHIAYPLRRFCCVPVGLVACVFFIGSAFVGRAPAFAQGENDTLRIIAFGAHPDDCEIEASGVARMWADRGHKVKFVSVTNGDIGHFEMAGGPLARRRQEEVETCADILGIETEVYDIHDGELMPTLANRKRIVRDIREWNADIVLAHRPNDYHPDHRYTGVLVRDAAYMVAVPHFLPLTPALQENPVILHYPDGFDKPYPFEADIAVGIDEVAEAKWDCLASLRSQFLEFQPAMAGELDEVPEGKKAQRAFMVKGRKADDAAVADEYRDLLIELYGEERGKAIEYAEAFSISEYGSEPTSEELKRLFPFFD